MSRASQQFAFISLFAIVFAVLQAACGTPVNNVNLVGNQGDPIVYRRWVRRRPSVNPSDFYVDDIVEEFHVRRRPSPHMLSDEDVDRIIRCDFDPSLKECENLSKPQIPVVEPNPQFPLTTVAPTRPTPSVPMSTRPTAARATTTIVPEIVTTTSRTILTTTTEYLPFLPDIPMSEHEITKESGQLDYDEEEYDLDQTEREEEDEENESAEK